MHSFDIFKAIFLGIIEGLTEFIPVSSTAHLLLVSEIIDFNSVQNNLFEIIIQSGAILAICVIYRKKLFDLLINIKHKEQQFFALNIFLAFLPAAVIGFFLHGFIKTYLFSNLVIALALIFGGLVMIIIEKKPEINKIDNFNKVTPKTALKVGFFQCLAMIPGVSRSGATIIGGMICGLNRKLATELSFLLAIPTIFAASAYDLWQNLDSLDISNIKIIVIGLLSSFISSIIVIKWFINYVTKNKFTIFAIYRIIIGVLIIFLIV